MIQPCYQVVLALLQSCPSNLSELSGQPCNNSDVTVKLLQVVNKLFQIVPWDKHFKRLDCLKSSFTVGRFFSFHCRRG